MKYFIVLLFLVCNGFTQETEYFRLYADIKDEPVYTRILQETNLVDVFTHKFQIVVNTGGKEPFVVIGEYLSLDVEWDRNAYRYDRLFFSPNVREKLLKCKNKIVLH